MVANLGRGTFPRQSDHEVCLRYAQFRPESRHTLGIGLEVAHAPCTGNIVRFSDIVSANATHRDLGVNTFYPNILRAEADIRHASFQQGD